MQNSQPPGLQIPPTGQDTGRLSNSSLLQHYFDASSAEEQPPSSPKKKKEDAVARSTGHTPSPTSESSPYQLKRRSTGSRTLRPEDLDAGEPSTSQQAQASSSRERSSGSGDLGSRGTFVQNPFTTASQQQQQSGTNEPRYPPPSQPYDLAVNYSLEDIALSADARKSSFDLSSPPSSQEHLSYIQSQRSHVSYTPPYKRKQLQHSDRARTSGLQRSSTLLQTAGQALRRASVRVVNLGGQDHEAISRAEALQADLERDKAAAAAAAHHGLREKEDDVESDAGFQSHAALPTRSAHQQGFKDAGDTQKEEAGHVAAAHPSSAPSEHMLVGRTLNLFGPRHPLRRLALKLMLNAWVEPIILLLIIANVVVLTLQAAPSVFSHPRPSTAGYFHTWHDSALFVFMCIFTVEIVLRVIVSGLFFSPTDHWWVGKSWPNQRTSPPTAPHEKRKSSLLSSLSSNPEDSRRAYPHQPLSRAQSDLSIEARPQGHILSEVPFKLAVDHLQQITVSQKAYLRHSYNRIDLVAVVSFWITFVLASTGAEQSQWLYVFRGLSVLRATRLLTFTTGSLIILHSLKRAGPSLLRVAFFILFALSLFAIVGVQSFAGSYRRECVWLDPEGGANFSTGQLCGSWYDNDGNRQIYLEESGNLAAGITFRGFACPQGQVCITGDNPNNGTLNFDNIFSSAFQVLVIASNNGWSGVMYDMMNAEMFFSCLFFIGGLIVMNYWLINMFVAVITYTFDSIVRETKHSAFSAHAPRHHLDKHNREAHDQDVRQKQSWFRSCIHRSELFWVALVIADTGIQGSRHNLMPASHGRLIKIGAIVATVVFDVEMVLRLLAALPDWKGFFRSARNRLDLLLAVVTTVLRIPPIPSTQAYLWLSVFERMRFYRVPLTIPRTRRLLLRLGGSLNGLSNMILFLLMISFVATLIAVQFLRGEIPAEIEGEETPFSFYQVYNGFLGIYQVLTSEDWTSLVFVTTGSAPNEFNVVVNFLFWAGWFIFANSIVLQMFIAVINEGFDLLEHEKTRAQEDRFAKAREVEEPLLASLLHKINFYRKMKPQPVMSVAHIVPALAVNSSRQAVVEEYLQGKSDISRSASVSAQDGFTASIRKLNPSNLIKRKKSVRTPDHPATAEDWLDVDQHLALLAPSQDPEYGEHEQLKQRRMEEVDFIMSHPTYDVSLWLFSQQSRIRNFCQTLVTPPYGLRIFGEAPNSRRVTIFQLLIFVSIVASVVIAAVATPTYRQKYYIEHGDLRSTWFNISEASLGFFFVLEFLVKIIADGVLWTPNAYFLSIWNVLDFVVLVTLVINVMAAIIVGGEAPSGLRALKAFRALRLVNLSPRTRKTFYDVLIIGASQLFDATMLAVLYIIPYAVWGQTLFSGKLFSCNDGDVANKFQCIGEYTSNPVNWEFLAPRAWANPHVWSFDSFKWAILILFELVSLEGWIDVEISVKNIVGINQQPADNASQFNAVFFVIYMLLGGLFIFALFTAIIIENFRVRSGMALLTAKQRRWIDIQKLLLQQKPSRRPRFRPTDVFSSWAYDRIVQKNGWWSKTMTVVAVLHTILLMTAAFGQPSQLSDSRDFIFLAFTFVFAVDIILRLFGLGFKMFRLSWWNIFDTSAVVGTFATTIPALAGGGTEIETQLQKLFLVALSFNLVQKNEALSQLFKTAVTSLPAILHILALWLILFLVFGIADLEVFSLTRWMENEAFQTNFSDMLTTLVMLGFMSSGEGWNAFMHDYTVEFPLCTRSSNFLFSDCGSPAWAYFLFICWNVISMYIFASMFVGVVVENFSYVFQLGGRVRNLTREDMRSFKRAWTACDPNRTGYIRRRQFAPFFAKLTGIFDVKIYPEDARLSNVMRSAVVQPFDPNALLDRRDSGTGVVGGVDLHLLNQKLKTIDFQDIARRRATFNRLYHEALMLAERGKGLSFNNTLMLLAHYKLLEGPESLLLEQRYQRERRLAEVNNFIGLDKVRSLLTTVHYRREFLRYRAMLHQRESQTGVPHIRIDTRLAAPDGASPLSAVMRSPSISSNRSPPQSPTPLSRQASQHSSHSRTAPVRSRSPSPGP